MQLTSIAALCLVLAVPVAGLWMLALVGPGAAADPAGLRGGSVFLDQLDHNIAPILRSLLVGLISATGAVIIGSALALQLWFLGARPTPGCC